jgi:hypothetical protein
VAIDELQALLLNVGFSDGEISTFISLLEKEIRGGHIHGTQSIELFCEKFLNEELARRGIGNQPSTRIRKIGAKLAYVVEAIVLGMLGNAAYQMAPSAIDDIKKEFKSIRSRVENSLSSSSLVWPIENPLAARSIEVHVWEEEVDRALTLFINPAMDNAEFAAAAAGRVAKIHWGGTRNNPERVLVIEHGDELETRYLASALELAVSENDFVERGQELGWLLHQLEFRIVHQGRIVSPCRYLPTISRSIPHPRFKGKHRSPEGF